jgi:hypothetical protein
MLRIRLEMPGTRPRLSGSAKKSRLARKSKGSTTSRRLGRACPRLSQGECEAFVRTRRRCKKPSKLTASARRGCPGQARAGRVRVVSDLNFTIDLAEPDSRGTSPAMTSEGANNVVTSPISRLFVFPGQPPTRGEGKVRAPSFWPTQATSQGDNSGKLRGRRQNIRRL